jgi:hypothetical protein
MRTYFEVFLRKGVSILEDILFSRVFCDNYSNSKHVRTSEFVQGCVEDRDPRTIINHWLIQWLIRDKEQRYCGVITLILRVKHKKATEFVWRNVNRSSCDGVGYMVSGTVSTSTCSGSVSTSTYSGTVSTSTCSGTVSMSTRRFRVVHPDGRYSSFFHFLGKNYIIYVVIIFTDLHTAILVLMTEHKKFMKREMRIFRTPHIRPFAILLLLMVGI